MWKATSPLAVTYTTAVPVPLLGTVRGGTSNPLSKNDYGGEVRSLKCLWYCVNMLLTVIASSNSPISSPPLFVSVAIHTLDRPESEQPLVHHAPAGCVVLTHLHVCMWLTCQNSSSHLFTHKHNTINVSSTGPEHCQVNRWWSKSREGEK